MTTAWVPGSFEIPLIAQKMAETGKYDAIICLGAVIRGSTSHYDLVCNEAAKGIAQVSLKAGIPVMITNFAAGISPTPLTHAEVVECMAKNSERMKDLIMKSIELYEDDGSCECRNTLQAYGGFTI